MSSPSGQMRMGVCSEFGAGVHRVGRTADGQERVHPEYDRAHGGPWHQVGSRDNTAMTSQQRLTHIARPEGVAPGPGYTQVVTGTGQLVAVSGQVALDGNGQLVGPGDPPAQARQVFENLRRCLAAAGLSFGEVIKLTFQVVALARPEFLLEVEAFALAPGNH